MDLEGNRARCAFPISKSMVKHYNLFPKELILKVQKHLRVEQFGMDAHQQGLSYDTLGLGFNITIRPIRKVVDTKTCEYDLGALKTFAARAPSLLLSSLSENHISVHYSVILYNPKALNPNHHVVRGYTA